MLKSSTPPSQLMLHLLLAMSMGIKFAVKYVYDKKHKEDVSTSYILLKEKALNRWAHTKH